MKNTDWARALADYDFRGIDEFVEKVYQSGPVYPKKEKIYAALELTPLADTKVVILGQDPYPQAGKAQGLAFSYPNSFKVSRPDSMVNIQKELQEEGFDKQDTDLTAWAKQGVLLLNAVLTVPENQANGHAGKVWEPLTDRLIQLASEDARPKVFLLWGGYARKKAKLIDKTKHLVLESAHPSPLSARRGFFGSDSFLKANRFLEEQGRDPIDWSK
ncbi:uracil-DNA glycosylase [Lactococcus termiticola]|uniref:Uracil-DNA glycosylase n=1 Tax=Lactococcus termiticola TaxID=2169526 RepID=A0A2R5HET8_9LACT|nr:uracil-DNA glycosylase [Lactococcus termiticola]GBG96584.1 uracil-DNA glycosylase [Lactococcus termiticola]